MFILVNLKAYDCDPESVVEAMETVAPETEATLAIAPQTAQLASISSEAVERWAQHVSPVGYGSHTGSTLASALSDAGAEGTLLNHSERRLRLADIADGIEAAKKAGLSTCVCANTPAEAAAVAALGPDAVAIEPPELIGTGTPVSKADPAIVTEAVERVETVDDSIKTFCGAGISTGEDIVAAESLGASGVLLASGVAAADDPATALRELVSDL